MSFKCKSQLHCLLQVVLIFYFTIDENQINAASLAGNASAENITIKAIGFYPVDLSSENPTRPDNKLFVPYEKPLSEGTYWVKISLENSGIYSHRVLLNFPSFISKLTSYQLLATGDSLVQYGGFEVAPSEKRHVFKYQCLIEVEVISKKLNTVFLKVDIRGSGFWDIAPDIEEISTLRDRMDVYRNIAIIFSAVFLILGLYNFILYFIIDERGFLFYAMMVLGFALMASIPLLNHLFKAPVVTTLSILAASFIVYSGSHFAIHFLKAPNELIWNKLLKTLATVNLVMVILIVTKLVFLNNSLFFNRISSLAAALSALALVAFWIITAASVWKSRDIRGKYFLMINLPVLISTLIFTIIWLKARFSGMPVDWETSVVVTIIFYTGAVMQLVAFSLVFGYHIKGLEFEKLEIQTRLNKELEVKVEERTNNLQRANEKIHEQKDELIRLNDLKDKLFTIISHDLRSPLNSLKGMLGLFSVKSMPEEEVNLFVSKINNTLSHTSTVLDNLLHWSKSQMTGIKLESRQFSIDHLIEKNIELMQPLAEDKKIEINKALFTQDVVADENMINIVIRNLLSNAVKFTRIGGKIDINMTSENSILYVAVEDNGLGMDRGQLSKLFQITDHHSSVGTVNEKGTGLGLILSQEFIRHNGGEIKVTSELKKGSVFTFSLPLTNLD